MKRGKREVRRATLHRRAQRSILYVRSADGQGSEVCVVLTICLSQATLQLRDELKYANERSYESMIKIEKVRDGYFAHATPPHGKEEWKNAVPLSSSELVKELRSRGIHTTDISDAFHEADPNWLQSMD